MRKKFIPILSILIIYLAACAPTVEPPVTALCSPSTQGITLLPTTEPVADPDLYGENPRDYVYATDCGSLAEPTPKTAETAILAVLTGAVQNATLDSHDAQIGSVAASAHMTAVAWTQDGGVYVGISWGKGGFEIARDDDNANPDLAISGVGRLHLVYEKQGAIYYRASDGSSHPPGDPVFPRDLMRPAINLAGLQDHVSNGQMVLVWDTLLADHERKDIAIFDRLIGAACPKGKVTLIRSTAAQQPDLDLFGPPAPSAGGNARIGALCRWRFAGDQKRTSGDARDAALPLHPDPSRKIFAVASENETMLGGM